jgi:long-chain acyl-CoA synthetase
MAGYYCQPERTAEVLEKSGWLHTNMVAERCPDGAFRMVASLRPHHAVTSNGQCIDLERLEALYARHPLCTPGGVCLLVHPYRRYVCALVLTSEARVRAFVAAEAGACVDGETTSAATTKGGALGNEGDRLPSSSSTSSPGGVSTSAGGTAAASASSPLAALAAAAAEPGWWPRCLRDPALNAAAAQSLAGWATAYGGRPPSSDDNVGGDVLHAAQVRVAPHERVRRVRLLYDVWDAARHTRTATGRLLRYGIHCRYSAVIHELFVEPD